MKNTIKKSFSLLMIMMFIIGNLNLSFADSKNDLDTNLNKLYKIVLTIEKNSTKKVAKKQLRESKKVYKKIKKIKCNAKLKSIALEYSYSVVELCEDLKKEKKMAPTLFKLKIENCKSQIKSVKIINKGIKGKKTAEIIRSEAANQLINKTTLFEDKVLAIFTSNKEYDKDNFDDVIREIIYQTSDVNKYFKIEETNVDVEVENLCYDITNTMYAFKHGKISVGEYRFKIIDYKKRLEPYLISKK